ncbi:hypothetical protein KO527_03355 [Pseudoalteromonas sp. C2R02]|uniref:hypothetical protein n=1 Tax=Pseudoalteromonas sp. C2R02 TaxID=2841565 RepID=UPI001C098919|nr:hypothetical protein [Pseudoalteromonas sp. C2R02]MBU2968392.1 hypothetical protein [Pseudoalteromonas sp. C2R02]
MLKLNEYNFKFEKLFKKAPITIAIRLEDMADASIAVEDKVDAVWILTGKYQQLAYANYVLENNDEVKPYLEKAAPFAFLSGFDPELKAQNNEWTIQNELTLTLLFGDKSIIGQLNEFKLKLLTFHPQIR